MKDKATGRQFRNTAEREVVRAASLEIERTSHVVYVGSRVLMHYQDTWYVVEYGKSLNSAYYEGIDIEKAIDALYATHKAGVKVLFRDYARYPVNVLHMCHMRDADECEPGYFKGLLQYAPYLQKEMDAAMAWEERCTYKEQP